MLKRYPTIEWLPPSLAREGSVVHMLCSAVDCSLLARDEAIDALAAAVAKRRGSGKLSTRPRRR